MNTGTRYYTIGEVADLIAEKTTVIRFWEKEFTHLQVKKNKFGHRVYTEEDVIKIKEIKKLLRDNNMSIKDVKELFIKNNFESQDNTIVKNMLNEVIELLNKKREIL